MIEKDNEEYRIVGSHWDQNLLTKKWDYAFYHVQRRWFFGLLWSTVHSAFTKEECEEYLKNIPPDEN